MNRGTYIAVAVIPLMIAGTTFAAYPLATDDAGTVTVAEYELEAGYDNCRDENERINTACGVSFKTGITEKLDIGLSFPYQVDPDQDENLGEASLSIKFALVKDMAAVTFTNEFGAKGYFVNAIYTKEFPIATCNLNAGYLSSGDESVRGAGSYGVSLEFPVHAFDIVGEVQGQEGGTGSALAGLRYRVSQPFFVATGVSKSFKTDENTLTAGLHIEF